MNRTTIITEAQGKPYNEQERANTFQMLVNALSGEWGSGEWNDKGGDGFWVKQGIMWQAKIVYAALPLDPVRLPFRAKNAIAKAYRYQLSGSPQNQIFIEDSNEVSFYSYAGQPVIIVIEPTKIVKE